MDEKKTLLVSLDKIDGRIKIFLLELYIEHYLGLVDIMPFMIEFKYLKSQKSGITNTTDHNLENFKIDLSISLTIKKHWFCYNAH